MEAFLLSACHEWWQKNPKQNKQNLVFTFELFTVQRERHELKIHTNK